MPHLNIIFPTDSYTLEQKKGDWKQSCVHTVTESIHCNMQYTLHSLTQSNNVNKGTNFMFFFLSSLVRNRCDPADLNMIHSDERSALTLQNLFHTNINMKTFGCFSCLNLQKQSMQHFDVFFPTENQPCKHNGKIKLRKSKHKIITESQTCVNKTISRIEDLTSRSTERLQ